MTFTQGQTGLTALEGLTLTLLIATEQEGAIRRIEIETYHIPELLFKGQILGKFLAFESMRSDRVSRPQTVCTLDLLKPVSRAIARTLQGPPPGACRAARLRAERMALAAIVGLRPRPGASLSPSRPLAAQRFLQRPMAKRLTPCSRDISSWLSPPANPRMILALKTSR